ncbi:protein of unknown function [Mesotoga infera]|uniref:Uncharacterized protein n=1 Tax=Mesotoga infera TaxID=1236046 RepID=A0A7Z7PQR4_9BACT|nr:protein of unknown function [Mesotoga infera]
MAQVQDEAPYTRENVEFVILSFFVEKYINNRLYFPLNGRRGLSFSLEDVKKCDKIKCDYILLIIYKQCEYIRNMSF